MVVEEEFPQEGREEGLEEEMVEQEALGGSAPEVVQMLSRNYYLVKSQELEDFIEKYCPSLKPAFDHLNLTSNIDGRTERLLRLYMRYILDVAKLMWKKEEIDIDRVVAHEALYIRSIFAISDARAGWKGRLYITSGRLVSVERSMMERRRRWFW